MTVPAAWSRAVPGLTVLLAAFLAWGGVRKLAGVPAEQALLADGGFPPGFVLLVGALECLAAVLLFVPRLRSYVALAVAVVLGLLLISPRFITDPWRQVWLLVAALAVAMTLRCLTREPWTFEEGA
ncbi:MAG: DoxX family protein [Gemmatimonadales bacterium]|nr:DoxX family protein [Gemmatimonadales bacterium]